MGLSLLFIEEEARSRKGSSQTCPQCSRGHRLAVLRILRTIRRSSGSITFARRASLLSEFGLRIP
ncbi:hypothetical protein BKA56DRAFT_601072 [Ilyonectria sp. MPI-CAGE-AT-0026]|nr:hypothetical protein BKA56DRAFT_601072 [Ilyonectria sp. MPI-CAGE-AT-0026]